MAEADPLQPVASGRYREGWKISSGPNIANKSLEVPLLMCLLGGDHSWERGPNENTNGLIRQYSPKGMSMDSVLQVDCSLISHGMNHRPRKLLGFSNPEEYFNVN